MTTIGSEEQARNFLTESLCVSRETFDLLDRFVSLIADEMERQNLIAPSTLPDIWTRHILDSAQLLLHCERSSDGLWLDIGSGAGFPGLVVAILTERPLWLVEPRQLRADFLMRCVEELGLGARVEVHKAKVERLDPTPADVISARAVASLPKLLSLSQGFSTPQTRWLLPKGRNAGKELDEARRDWVVFFKEKPSLTDPESAILVGTVKGRKQ